MNKQTDTDWTFNNRWVSVVEFYDQALGIGKVFGQEPTVVKWNYQIGVITSCQKLGIILEKIDVIKKCQ